MEIEAIKKDIEETLERMNLIIFKGSSFNALRGNGSSHGIIGLYKTDPQAQASRLLPFGQQQSIK